MEMSSLVVEFFFFLMINTPGSVRIFRVIATRRRDDCCFPNTNATRFGHVTAGVSGSIPVGIAVARQRYTQSGSSAGGGTVEVQRQRETAAVVTTTTVSVPEVVHQSPMQTMGKRADGSHVGAVNNNAARVVIERVPRRTEAGWAAHEHHARTL